MSKEHCSICKQDAVGIMLKCYACDLKFHASCANVSESTANELLLVNGLHFYCAEHRIITVSDLLKKISKLQSFHVELKSLVDQYKDVLEMTPVSELWKLDGRKGKAVQSPSLEPELLLRSGTKRQVDCPPIIIKRKKQHQVSKQAPVVDLTSSSASGLSENNNTQQVPETEIVQNVPSFSSVVANKTVQNNEVSAEPVQEFVFSAVPPLRKVFVSRLPTDLSTDVIRNHIKTRLKMPNMFLDVMKLPVRDGAPYSSMIINVGHNEDVFNAVMDHGFWPQNTVVRADIPRELRMKKRPQFANSKN